MMNLSTRRTLLSSIAVILLLSACAGPMPAATQDPALAQQVIEQSVALTVAAKDVQAKEQQVAELSDALTVAAQNAQTSAVLTPTTTPEAIETIPDITDLATFTATPFVPASESTSNGTLDPNAPTVKTISPNSGFTSGGGTVTITGTNFVVGEGNIHFYFGDREATEVVCVSTTQCTATIPQGTQGNVIVRAVLVVNKPSGNSNPDTFNYIALDPNTPVIERITPREGPMRGGITVTIAGRNFLGGKLGGDPNATKFYFGENEATDVICETDQECKVKSPAGKEGFVVVRAENITENGVSVKSQHVENNDYDGFKYNGQVKYGCSVLTTAPKKSTVFRGGDHFTIKWIVTNTGQNTWPAGIDVKYSAGVKMSTSTSVEIPMALKPNDSYAFQIDAVAPSNPSTYYMNWIVEGMGCNAYVAIVVE